jgi:hypothetical protein
MPRRRNILIGFIAAALLGPIAGFAARYRPDPLPLTLTTSPAVIVSVTGGSASKIQWGVTPEADRVAAGQSLYLSGPPGQYQVTAAVLSAGDVGLLQLAVTVPPSAPAPGPGPIPPGPAPVTPVATGQTWALAVFDTSQQISLPAGQLALYKSQTVVAALAPLGVTYRHYDIGDPAVTGSVWGAAAVKLQRPALVLWRGKQIVQGYPVNLPATEADLVSLVTKAVQP